MGSERRGGGEWTAATTVTAAGRRDSVQRSEQSAQRRRNRQETNKKGAATGLCSRPAVVTARWMVVVVVRRRPSRPHTLSVETKTPQRQQSLPHSAANGRTRRNGQLDSTGAGLPAAAFGGGFTASAHRRSRCRALHHLPVAASLQCAPAVQRLGRKHAVLRPKMALPRCG